MAYTRMTDLEYFDELEVIAECEKARPAELIEVNKSIREWTRSPEMVEFGKTARVRFLKDEIKRIKNEKKDRIDMMCLLVGTNGACLIPMIENQVGKLVGKLQKDIVEKRHLEGKTREGGITPDMIERAKDYPIASLIEVDRAGKAKCINHNDKHPSMDCRKNFVYCYSCGYSADAIGVYQKIHGVGFIDAVKALTSG